jgi:ParB family chromosome partitioning protein
MLAQLDTATRTADQGDSWGTPVEIIEAARRAMGSIDCDPATNHEAQARVKAGVAFTRDDDGLSKDWIGNVWMNPPYSQPLVSQFAEKLLEEIDAGRATQACVLVNNATETKWFARLASVATCICFPTGRV